MPARKVGQLDPDRVRAGRCCGQGSRPNLLLRDERSSIRHAVRKPLHSRAGTGRGWLMNTPKPLIVDQAALDWEGWRHATLASESAVRWKLLISGERTASRGLVTGVAQLAPGARLLLHHHEPEETYYIVSGQGSAQK